MREALLCPQCGQSIPADAPGGMCPVCQKQAEPANDVAEQATIPPAASDPDRHTRPPQTPARPGVETIAPPLAAFVSEPAATGARIPFAEIPGYEILGELGRGGMGVVYKARHKKLGRLVALKMILAGGHAGEAELARFRTEAEAIARVKHANIIQIHEIGEHEGKPYFSLEFCAGGSLAQKINGTPMQPKEAARMVEMLAHGMAAAHQEGVIHRDLKPANVLLSPLPSGEEGTGVRGMGTPKITDFGLAKKLDDAGQTQSGAIMGTPSYMSPEQAEGKISKIGPAADIYALGAILYELLTGRPPFKAATWHDTILQLVAEEPVPPSQLQKQVPRDVETICLKCLQKDPAKRYASAEALADDLGRYQKGEPIQARPVGSMERVAKWVKRRPVVAGLIAAVVLVAFAGLGAFGWAFDQTVQERDIAKGERENAKVQEMLARKAEAAAKQERDLADKARQFAEMQKSRAEKQLLRAESFLYIHHFAEAHNHFLNHDLVRCRLALQECRLDLRGPEYGYLVKQLERKALTLFGHTNTVSSLALSSDGKRLVSGSWDKAITVWDLEAGKEMFTLRAHTGDVWSLALSGDGKQLFSGSKDKTIRVWDLESGKESLTLRGHIGDVRSLALSGDSKRLVSGSIDQTIKVWNLAAGMVRK